MFVIQEYRLNTVTTGVTHLSPSFGTFDVHVLLEEDNLEKWVSIPHELFFEYIKVSNSSLHSYVESNNFDTWELAIDNLDGLGYDFGEAILKYIEVSYSKFVFRSMTDYDPDFEVTCY